MEKLKSSVNFQNHTWSKFSQSFLQGYLLMCLCNSSCTVGPFWAPCTCITTEYTGFHPKKSNHQLSNLNLTLVKRTETHVAKSGENGRKVWWDSIDWTFLTFSQTSVLEHNGTRHMSHFRSFSLNVLFLVLQDAEAELLINSLTTEKFHIISKKHIVQTHFRPNMSTFVMETGFFNWKL